MTCDLLLVVGVLLATASQLRPEGVPFGLGESCLAVWVILIVGSEFIRPRLRCTPAFSRLLIFWLLFAMAESIGTLAGYAINDVHDTSAFVHDAMAYPLLAAISLLSAADPHAESRLHRINWLLVTMGSALLAVQAAQAWNLISIGSTDPWYWDRFRGLSQNPNQLAIVCAALGLLSLHLAEVATSKYARMAAIATAILPVYVGRLTKSDAFSLVLVVGCAIFIALKLQSSLFYRPLRLQSALALIVVVAMPLLLASVAPFARSIDNGTQALVQDLAKGDEQDTAQVRLALWQKAIERGMDSDMLGLGPGPHLPIPASILAGREVSTGQPNNLDHPPNNGTPNFEAHNTLLDVFTQGGLLAVLDLVWLVALAFTLSYSARWAGLTTLVCGLVILSIFHLIIRQPTFWLAIATCLVAADSRRRSMRAWSL
jgi:hypothetical protein